MLNVMYGMDRSQLLPPPSPSRSDDNPISFDIVAKVRPGNVKRIISRFRISEKRRKRNENSREKGNQGDDVVVMWD